MLKYINLQPSEIERLPFWQYELMVETIEELNKKEKEEQEEQEKGYKMPKGIPSYNDIKNGNYGSVRIPKTSSMPKTTSMPKIPRM